MAGGFIVYSEGQSGNLTGRSGAHTTVRFVGVRLWLVHRHAACEDSVRLAIPVVRRSGESGADSLVRAIEKPAM